MIHIKKIAISLLFFSIALSACKMKANGTEPEKEVPKKKHKLEKTQWKATASKAQEPDILLDFYTHEYVQEYVMLPNGKEIKARKGSYKLSKRGYLKIKFGKLSIDRIDGYIKKDELIINERLKTRTYYKVKDY